MVGAGVVFGRGRRSHDSHRRARSQRILNAGGALAGRAAVRRPFDRAHPRPRSGADPCRRAHRAVPGGRDLGGPRPASRSSFGGTPGAGRSPWPAAWCSTSIPSSRSCRRSASRSPAQRATSETRVRASSTNAATCSGSWSRQSSTARAGRSASGSSSRRTPRRRRPARPVIPSEAPKARSRGTTPSVPHSAKGGQERGGNRDLSMAGSNDGTEGRRAQQREAEIPNAGWEREVAHALETGLTAAPSITDRQISTFSRGELPHFAGINTFLKAPYVEDVHTGGRLRRGGDGRSVRRRDDVPSGDALRAAGDPKDLGALHAVLLRARRRSARVDHDRRHRRRLRHPRQHREGLRPDLTRDVARRFGAARSRS